MIRATFLMTIGVSLALLAAGLARPSDASAAGLLPEFSDNTECADESIAGEPLHHAGVVVVFPDGTDTYCIAFEEDEMSGAELLQRTGLEVLFGGFGGLGSAVCRIDDIGCGDPGDCWCECQGADCHYWSYYKRDGNDWRFLQIGASQRRVRDGDIDAWVWGNGRTPPNRGAAASLCRNALPTATRLPTPQPESSGAAVPTTVGAAKATPTSVGSSLGDSSPAASITEQSSSRDVIPTETPRARVVGQSSRPTTEGESVTNASQSGNGGGVPVGLLSFGAAGAGIIAVAAVAALRRVRGH